VLATPLLFTLGFAWLGLVLVVPVQAETAPADSTHAAQPSPPPSAPPDSAAGNHAPSSQGTPSPVPVPPPVSPTPHAEPPHAQTFQRTQGGPKGVLEGVVLDQEDRQPLPNAGVGIYRIMPSDSEWTLVEGILTGQDGKFHFELPPATYRAIFHYQSYSVLVRDNLKVAPGGILDVSVTLTPRPLQLKGIEVKGQEAKGTEASALNKQKKAEVVSDALTSEQISKSTDSNAAEALQRVTGLSVVGGKYVYVRGLGERYSSTQVNGTSVGTPEPNKKVVPLDVFPSGALDNIVVQKTYTPDQEGEFAGGVINLSTRDFTMAKNFSQTLSVGYSAYLTDKKFLTYQGGKLDFLGFDDGTRDYPDLFKSKAGDKPVVQKGVFGGPGFSAQEIQELGRSFNKVWTPETVGGAPNYGYSMSYSNTKKLLGKDVGLLGAFSLANSFSTQDRENNAYSGTSTRLQPLYLYDVRESNQEVLGGGMANLSVRLAPEQTIRVRGLYTRSSDDNTWIQQGPNYNYGAELFRVTSLDFVERGLFLGVLDGSHQINGLGKLQADWHASYSEAMRDEPDRRDSAYESDGRGGILLTGREQLPLTRIFGDMHEYDRSLGADLQKPFRLWGTRDTKFKFGGAFRKRNRMSAFRRLGFTLGTAGRDSLDLSLPPESLLVDPNIRPGYFALQENTRANDAYDASQEIHAGYGMATIPVLSRLDLLIGARVEMSDQFVESKSPFVGGPPPEDIQLKNTNTLPSINATARITDAMNVRGGYSLTVSRPELREMSPFNMYDYETGYTEEGNPDIKSTTIENYDARWELFPGTNELLAVSVFRKTLYQPIEDVVLGSSGGYILQPRNGRDGRLEGVELETRVGVRSIWNALPLGKASSSLDHWAVNVNFSAVESSVRVSTTSDAAGAPIFKDKPLQGQSDYALNAGLFYGSNTMQGSLLLSKFGKRLAQVGAGAYPSSLPDIYEYPPATLDLQMSKRLWSSASLKFSAENLLNQETEFLQLGLPTRKYTTGRTFSLSMAFKD